VDLKVLHAKIGEFALAGDYLSGAFDKAGLWSPDRRSTVRSNCGCASGEASEKQPDSVYYRLRAPRWRILRSCVGWINELHLDHPSASSRMLPVRE
jgi:hypothetical protein